MALWKESTPSPANSPGAGPINVQREPSHASDMTVRMGADRTERLAVAPAPAPAEPARRVVVKEQRVEGKESVIASDLSIEGKIEGSGHVRIAGKFKGDVRVDGNLTIDQGAQVNGQVIASVVIVAGELNGNIGAAKRVELLETGLIAGDVKAGSLTVAAGSRMRGQVEFGWDDHKGVGNEK